MKSPEPITENIPDMQRISWRNDPRLLGFAGYCLALILLFIVPLQALVRYALKEEIHSHILLIPVVSLYLGWQTLLSKTVQKKTSVPGASILILMALGLFLLPNIIGHSLDPSSNHSRWAACFVLLVGAGGFLFLGMDMMRVLAFPFAFLAFMIPLPDSAVFAVEQVLMRWSADVSYWFFQWTGTPTYRKGQVFELPGMTLEVAPECSGIRSTFVLFITSLVASFLFLKSSVHRAILVAFVIPLGIIRNALRVLVIGLLCVHQGPHMIDGWIHKKGGSLFFAISLVPLLLIAWYFRRRESRITSNHAKALKA